MPGSAPDTNPARSVFVPISFAPRLRDSECMRCATRTAEGTKAMTTIAAGTLVKKGYYFSTKSWSLQPVPADGAALPGEAGETYLQIPLLLAFAAAPVMGAAFLMFLPFIGFYLAGTAAVRPVARVFRRSARELAATVQPGWAPGEAHLAGRSAEVGGDEARDARLDRLEQENRCAPRGAEERRLAGYLRGRIMRPGGGSHDPLPGRSLACHNQRRSTIHRRSHLEPPRHPRRAGRPRARLQRLQALRGATAAPPAPGTPGTLPLLPPPSAMPPSAAVPETGAVQQRIAAEERLVAQNPKDVQAWIALGNDYFDTNQSQRAVDAYAKALALQPDNADVLTDQGVMYRKLQAFDKAVANFQRAHQVDPRHVQSVYNLGVVYAYDLKDPAKAIAAWNRVIEVGPQSPQAAQARQNIQDLRSPQPQR